MEVHHTHTTPIHGRTGRKKWTHYLWEFFMLFLAVFCGFLAENQREHYVEHRREKQYIRSLIEDLKSDTTGIGTGNLWFDKICAASDTLLLNFESFTSGSSAKAVKSLTYILSGYPDFVYTDRTMQQLKNAGGLRLIRNQSASDSITSYDATIRDLSIEESEVTVFYDQIQDNANKLFSFRKLDQQQAGKNPDELAKTNPDLWLTHDSRELEHFYNVLRKYKTVIFHYKKYLERFKNKESRLIDLLKREYHIKY